MAHIDALIIDLALILILAAATSILFKWLKQPVVLGYILAGYLASNHFRLMPNISDVSGVGTWAEIGIIFLLFGLGLEFSFKKLLNVGGSALISALVIVAGMMITGFTTGKLLGWSSTDSVFLGGMLSMSSTTIIIKAFSDLGIKGQKFTGAVFGVLIVEDLFAVILMVILSSIYVGKSVESVEMVWGVLKLVFFLILWFGVGIYIIPSLLKRLKHYLNGETLLIVSLGLCLGMVVLANYVGFSSALGAFVMGSILSESVESKSIIKITSPVRDLFGAVFFVSVGMLVDPAILAEYWIPIMVITLIVIIGQIGFGTIGMLISGQPLDVSIKSGFSLAQIGEFAFIIASLGMTLGVTSSFLYPVAVAVSVITTFATPFIIKLADPLYKQAEQNMPPKLKSVIEQYSSGTLTANTQSDWKILLRAYIRNLLIFSVLLCGMVWIQNSFLTPFILNNISQPELAKGVATVASLMMIAPFIWGLALRRIQPKVFIKLWTDSHFNRGLIISLILLRVFISLLFIMSVLIGIYSYRIGLVVGVGIITVIMLLFSRRIQKWWLHFENQFTNNLSRSEGDIENIDHNSKYMHITHLTMAPESNFVGKSIGDLNLRNRFGITLIHIKRGEKSIPIPMARELLMPYDELSIVGNDHNLRNFLNHTEQVRYQKHTTEPNDEMEMKQFWINKNSPLVGQTIAGSEMRPNLECMVIGMERVDGEVIEPRADVEFKAGDLLWLVGRKSSLKELVELYK